MKKILILILLTFFSCTGAKDKVYKTELILDNIIKDYYNGHKDTFLNNYNAFEIQNLSKDSYYIYHVFPIHNVLHPRSSEIQSLYNNYTKYEGKIFLWKSENISTTKETWTFLYNHNIADSLSIKYELNQISEEEWLYNNTFNIDEDMEGVYYFTCNDQIMKKIVTCKSLNKARIDTLKVKCK